MSSAEILNRHGGGTKTATPTSTNRASPTVTAAGLTGALSNV